MKKFFKTNVILIFIIVLLSISSITVVAISKSNSSIRAEAKETLSFTGFPIPHNSYPMDITSGPDGNIWFTENWRNTIGRMTPDGTLTEFPLSVNNRSLISITAGPDGNLWFTYSPYESKIGRITPSGAITEYTIPPIGISSNIMLWDITAGPDGNLWFTERQGNQIGRITPNGTITEFPLPTTGSPLYITAGPDGNLWFTEQNDKIGRITPEGNISEFPVPKDSMPWDITAGHDGNLWFTENAGNKIGRITVDGKITEFSTHNTNQPFRITTGPDGNLWFTEILANKLGRITTKGVVTEFQIPEIFAQPWGRPDSITTGSDGNLWFTEYGGDMIGRVTLSGVKEPGPDRDFDLLAPFNNGVTWIVSSGYFNNRDQSKAGCHIGLGPDHCRNQLFGLDLVPDQQNDTAILAPGNGKVIFRGKLEDEDCIGLRITLDNGLNLNVCHFASFNVTQGERIVRGKVLGTRSTPHVHLSLDDRYRIGTLCPGKDRCFLPIPFDGQHTLEGMSLNPNPNGETVTLPYLLCDRRKVNCQFNVGFQQYQGMSGTSTNVAIP